MRKFLRLFGIGAFVCYGALCIYFYLFQEEFIFFPARAHFGMPEELSYEDVLFTTEDGETLHGWYTDNESSTTVLYFHGNGGNISFLPYQMKIFDTLGLSSLVFDYRGYGKSSGTIRHEKDLYADASAAYQYLIKKKGIEPDAIILWGDSLGGAVALELASRVDSQAVIIESTFASTTLLARLHYPYLPTHLLLRYRMESIDKIDRINSPILVLHGNNDDLIPPSHAFQLFDRAHEPKTLSIISDTTGHVPLNSSERYIPTLQSFFDTHIFEKN